MMSRLLHKLKMAHAKEMIEMAKRRQQPAASPLTHTVPSPPPTHLPYLVPPDPSMYATYTAWERAYDHWRTEQARLQATLTGAGVPFGAPFATTITSGSTSTGSPMMGHLPTTVTTAITGGRPVSGGSTMPSNNRRKYPTGDQWWKMAQNVGPHGRRVMLWGPPGTGKSLIARTAGVKDPNKVFPVCLHSDLPAAELRGHFIPQETGGLKWMDGPAVAAWRTGGRLVLDEIDKLGDDGMSFILGILDDAATAKLVLGTTGEIITPHADFTVWATMNGEPDDLPPPLLDRFPVSIKIETPNPEAIAALPKDLQGMARKFATKVDPREHIGLRAFMEFANLRESLDDDEAGFLTFGARWNDIADDIYLAGKADPR